jgi:hypothetical protein
MLSLPRNATRTEMAPPYPRSAASQKRNAPNLPAGWKKSTLNRKVIGLSVSLTKLW